MTEELEQLLKNLHMKKITEILEEETQRADHDQEEIESQEKHPGRLDMQHRGKQSAHRENRYPGGAGQRREEGEHERRHDRQTTRQPADERLKQPQQALTGLIARQARRLDPVQAQGFKSKRQQRRQRDDENRCGK